MGMDWHPYAESRGNDGVWKFLKKFTLDDPDPNFSNFKERNYTLFGVITRTSRCDGPPLFPDRGCPMDACAEISSEICGRELHSTTWFMVAELLSTDWNKSIGEEVVVRLDPDSYARWLKAGRRGCPEDLTIHGKDRLISEEEMVLLLMTGAKTGRKGQPRPRNYSRLKSMPYVEVRSVVSYRDMVPDFIDKTIPALVRLGDPENVRIVVGFDS